MIINNFLKNLWIKILCFDLVYCVFGVSVASFVGLSTNRNITGYDGRSMALRKN